MGSFRPAVGWGGWTTNDPTDIEGNVNNAGLESSFKCLLNGKQAPLPPVGR